MITLSVFSFIIALIVAFVTGIVLTPIAFFCFVSYPRRRAEQKSNKPQTA